MNLPLICSKKNMGCSKKRIRGAYFKMAIIFIRTFLTIYQVNCICWKFILQNTSKKNIIKYITKNIIKNIACGWLYICLCELIFESLRLCHFCAINERFSNICTIQNNIGFYMSINVKLESKKVVSLQGDGCKFNLIFLMFGQI